MMSPPNDAFLSLPRLADSRLTRKTPPTYGDGVYTINGGGRPSPRTLSQAFMKGYDGLGSLKNRTALATFFGKDLRRSSTIPACIPFLS